MKARAIPNILSVLRIVMACVFPVLFFGLYPNVLPAMLLFVLAGLTDIIDGALARRNGWVSDAGKILDPLADKLMQITVLVCLAVKNIIPLWLPVICILKELCMLSGAFFVFRRENTIVVSRWCGKLAVCVFYAAMFTLGVADGRIGAVGTVIISLVTLAAALLALVLYFKEFAVYATSRRMAGKDKSPDSGAKR